MTLPLFVHADATPAVLTSDGQCVTYQMLRHDIAQAAALLQPRSLLFIVGHNDYAVVRWYLAALEYGHVVMLLPADLADSQLHNLLQLYQPRYLLAPPSRRMQLPPQFQPCSLDWQDQGAPATASRFSLFNLNFWFHRRAETGAHVQSQFSQQCQRDRHVFATGAA